MTPDNRLFDIEYRLNDATDTWRKAIDMSLTEDNMRRATPHIKQWFGPDFVFRAVDTDDDTVIDLGVGTV
jgi:hypothetical protein